MRNLSRLIIWYLFFLTTSAFALMIPEHEHEMMVQKLQNPIAQMTTLPIFYDFDFDVKEGPDPGQLVTARPAIPVMLNKNWFLISRSVLGYFPEGGTADAETSFFLSKAQVSSNDVIWGIGPIAAFPNRGRPGYGPTAALFKEQDGPLAYGGLAKQLWFDEESLLNLQMILSYTFNSGYSIFAESDDTLDWDSNVVEGEITAGVLKIITLGDESLSFGAGLRVLSHGPEEERFGYGFRLMVNYIIDR